jgi:hypothetical protein
MGAPVTPDGRYFVVRGRLWRCSNPNLTEERRAELVAELMTARRAKRTAMRFGDAAGKEVARSRVDAAKIALGERGPVWWNDGAPDFNRHLARTTPCAEWFNQEGTHDWTLGGLFRRHLSEQYLTWPQGFAHFLRHENGLPQAAQSFWGRYSLRGFLFTD